MENEPGTAPPRPPERIDLLKLCTALNERGAKYVVVGGMAVIHHGFLRATEDIDLLIDPSRENQQKVRSALEILPDGAVLEMTEDDLNKYLVVRIADEIIVDLMLSACGISYPEAQNEVEWSTIDGVTIPFASAALLLKMKQTGREKDSLDRQFLEQKLRDAP
jgi:hypothetical protein